MWVILFDCSITDHCKNITYFKNFSTSIFRLWSHESRNHHVKQKNHETYRNQHAFFEWLSAENISPGFTCKLKKYIKPYHNTHKIVEKIINAHVGWRGLIAVGPCCLEILPWLNAKMNECAVYKGQPWAERRFALLLNGWGFSLKCNKRRD